MRDDKRGRDATFRAYDRGMKLKTGAAATVLAVVALLAGCTGTDKESAPATSSEATYSIDSWQNWGRAGDKWLEKCSDSDYGCIDDQVRVLITAASPLPPLDNAHGGVLLTLEDYRKMYRDYLSVCNTQTTDVRCTVRITQIKVYADSVRDVVSRMAEGR